MNNHRTHYKVVNKKDGLLVMKIYMLNEGLRELLKAHTGLWSVSLIIEEEYKKKIDND